MCREGHLWTSLEGASDRVIDEKGPVGSASRISSVIDEGGLVRSARIVGAVRSASTVGESCQL